MTGALLRDRLAALAIFGAVLGLGFFLIVWPGLRAETAARLEAENLIGQIALAERRGSAITPSAMDVISQENARHPALQPTDDAGLTGARLQSELVDLIEGAGGMVSQSSAGTVATDAVLPLLPLRLQFSGNEQVLRDVLATLDADRPDLRLQSLALRTLRSRDPLQSIAFDLVVAAISPVEEPR